MNGLVDVQGAVQHLAFAVLVDAHLTSLCFADDSVELTNADADGDHLFCHCLSFVLGLLA